MKVYMLPGNWEEIKSANAFTVTDDGSLWLWEMDTEKVGIIKRRVAVFPRGGWLGLLIAGDEQEVPRVPAGFRPAPTAPQA